MDDDAERLRDSHKQHSQTAEISTAQEKLQAEITERKRAEDRLGRVISRARCILWDARVLEKPDGTFDWDLWIHPSDIVRDLEMYFSPNESPSQVWSRHLVEGESGLARMNEAYHSALRNGTPTFRQEFCLRAKDDSARWMEEIVEVSRIQSGWDLVGVITDVTERKGAENAARAAQEAAEAATRSKSEFLANMSHEIRTPINGVIGITDLVLDSKLSAEQREHLQMVKASADSLLRVIDDILDFSKVEAGKFTLDPVGFALRTNIADTLKTLAVRAHEKRLELTLRVLPSVPNELVGDIGRLRQILINLIGNAIKFTERGEVAVKIEKEESLGDDIWLHFSVSDSGIGIPLSKLRAIFEPFEQADNTTSRTHGGTGLGLAISSGLVKLMGGRLWAESENGRGSTFHFIARFGRRINAAASNMMDRALDLQEKRILVVDDNRTSLRVIEEILFLWKMKCISVSCPRVALAELKRAAAAGQPFPVALIDAQMPEVNGFDLAQQIRLDPSIACPIIMMLSSARLKESVNQCKALGVAQYLIKPVGQSDLQNVVLTSLGAAPLEPKDATESGLALVAQGTRSLRILLAEDNEINQVSTVGILRKRGHTTVLANNGKEALACLTRDAFDVILMDIQMPRMGGFEATAAIRNAEKSTHQHIPIVALTAHALNGDSERCLKAGMDAYISKPLKAQALLDIIERLVLRSAGREKALIQDNASIERPFAGTPFMADMELGIAQELMAIFMKNVPEQLATIHEAIQSRDGEKLELGAHSFKSSVGYFGGTDASATAQKLENMGRKANFLHAEETFSRLKGCVARLIQKISAFRKD